MSKVKRVCPICGKTFYAYPSNIKIGKGIYCSRECVDIGKITKVEKTCPVCGKVFYAIPSEIERNKGIYCSLECRDIGITTKVERVCPICGKVFYTHPCKIKKGWGIYCSKKCMGIGNTIEIEKTCPVCGKVFYTKPGYIKSGKGIYCSPECRGIAQRGENSPNWKGGISFEPYCILFNNEFKERVRAFFDNKCALCGKTKEENGRSLCIHHVNYDKKTCCNDSERLFVPLCGSCHSKTNNNREYWEEYFKDLIKNEYGGKCYYTKEEYYK